jgi:biopolymer transport protein ExbD
VNWKVRHEGSPQSVEMEQQELVDSLLDGAWEPTDEVMGPDEDTWTAIESHPVLAEIAADLEQKQPKPYDDETRLDMNALIDVTLVLLIFFILTTTVAALQKRLEAPTVDDKTKVKVPVITEKEVQEQMIHVKAVMENGSPVVKIEETTVDPVRLVAELRKFVKETRKTDLLLEHDDNVPHDLVVKIIDSAKGAGMNRVRLLVP